MQEIINGDCFEIMKSYPDNHFTHVLTDPPYFLTNSSGSGFMGKTWDSIHGLSKYLWESNTFVNSALFLMNSLLLEKNLIEQNSVAENATTIIQKARNHIENVQSVNVNSLSGNALKKDSALLLVLTKQEVSDLLKELSPSHIKIQELYLNGVKENALFAIPITQLKNELNRIALKNVMPSLKVAEIEAQEIHHILMDHQKIRNVIEAMIGTKSENWFINGMNGNANVASSNAKENKFNVITLSHIKREGLTTWLTSLLCAINAMQESKTIQNYLIENFYKQIFKECLRVCKPGAPLLAFSGTRTQHKLVAALESAGWEIRDNLYWIYGSGFPKSFNFKEGEFEGFGTALKPAVEPCVLAMKPLDGTYAHNAEKWGVAGINIDECRIEGNKRSPEFKNPKSDMGYSGGTSNNHWRDWDNSKGRWPANVLFDEEAGQLLDEQSGILKSGHPGIRNKEHNSVALRKLNKTGNIESGFGDSGGASRFFYCAKASKSERNKGLEGFELKQTVGGGGTNNTDDDVCGKYGSIKALQQNNHPTVKPLKLIEYLLILITPPNKGLLLDPFLGSGTTLVAAAHLNIPAIGIEMEKEYCDIAQARLNSIEPNLFNI